MKVITQTLKFFDPSALQASCSNSSTAALRVLLWKRCPRNAYHSSIRYGSASQNFQGTRERSNFMRWHIIDGNRAAGNVAAPAVKRADDVPIVSPFEQKQGGLYSADVYDLNAENVDLVLNEVRPYLISDGGNVEVVSVDDGVVSLRLEGACGSCPSSTTTMKMGIERVLGEKFGESLKGVVQVDEQQIGATITGVDSLLETLRGAIHNYGGFVEVISVSPGEGRAEIKFKGPAPIGKGIQEAIKDKFPDIREVVLVTPQAQ